MVAVTIKSIKILNINLVVHFLKFQVKSCSFHIWKVLGLGWGAHRGGWTNKGDVASVLEHPQVLNGGHCQWAQGR